MLKVYELVVLLHPDLEIDVEAPIAKIDGLVKNAGGSIDQRDNWGKKRLAYRIGRQDFAIYLYFELSLPAESVRDFEATLGITEEVIRHLLVAKVDLPANSPRRAAKPIEVGAEADDTQADDTEADSSDEAVPVAVAAEEVSE